MNRNRDIAYTEQTPYTQHDDHRNRCISRTTKHRSDAVGKSQQKIEQRNGSRLHNSIMYYIRFTVKGCNKHRCGCINHNSDQFCNDNRTENAKPRSFFARSYCFAPRFWLTKVVSAIVKQVTGRNANPSILE